MTGGFTVTCKGQHVGQLSLCNHLLQFFLQLFCHFLTFGQRQSGAVVFVEAAFAVDTVKTAHLSVGRQQVDAERDTEPTAVNRPEYRRWIYYSTHIGCKFTVFSRQKNKRNKKIDVLMYLCLKKYVTLQPKSIFTFVNS